MIKGYVEDLTTGGVHLGDTLENSLELGEKHETFVAKCKSVSFGTYSWVVNKSLGAHSSRFSGFSAHVLVVSGRASNERIIPEGMCPI